MVFTMEPTDNGDAVREAAAEALDEEALAEVLARASGEDVGEDAALALREVTIDTIVADALAAAGRARWRGRGPTPEDVGEAAQTRRDCCDGSQPFQPTGLKFEW